MGILWVCERQGRVSVCIVRYNYIRIYTVIICIYTWLYYSVGGIEDYALLTKLTFYLDMDS